MNRGSRYTVADATRQRVLEAAAELGYSPSMSARTLRGKRELVIAIMPNWPIGLPSSRFFTSLDEAFAAEGLTFLIRYADPRSFSPEHLWRAMSPAAVLSFMEIDPATVARAHREGVSVTMAVFDRRHDAVHVDIPEQGTGGLQAAHLADTGRRTLAMATTTDARLDVFAVPRLQGIREVCAQRGLTPPRVVSVDLSPEQAQHVVMDLIGEGVDGICCYNDEVALAVLAGARLSGIRVPEQLAVIGVDDDPIASLSFPTLTTVRLDLAQDAVRIAGAVVAGIVGRPPDPLPENHNIATLVVREST
jgi:DNA-binding LacI/PurR family transcriptional regulator